MKPTFTARQKTLVNKVAAEFGYEAVEPTYYEEDKEMCGEEMKYTCTEDDWTYDIVVLKLKQVGESQTWVVSMNDDCGSENYWLDDGLNAKDLRHVFEYYKGVMQ